MTADWRQEYIDAYMERWSEGDVAAAFMKKARAKDPGMGSAKKRKAAERRAKRAARMAKQLPAV